MSRISTSQARDEFADILNRVAYKGERIVLQRRGKSLAAIIPFNELEFLERMIQEAEDRADADDFAKAKADFEASGEKAVPWKQVKKNLGIE